MSINFGPVHYWLFDQVRLVDRRTEKTLRYLAEASSQENAQQVRERMCEEFGKEVGESCLEELVIPPSIHEGLGRLIELVESREAAAVAAFSGEIDGLGNLYEEHGAEVAALIGSETGGQLSAEKIFDALQQVKLVGMPCDQVIQVVRSGDEGIAWQQSESLQRYHWRSGGVDLQVLFRLHGSWIAGFARALNPRARYKALFFRPDDRPASEELLVIANPQQES